MNPVSIESKETKINNYIVRASRVAPNESIMVIDSNTQGVVGEVVNFNETGMQLSMHNEMDLNLISELTLVLSNAQQEKQYIEVFAELLWIKHEVVDKIASVRGGFYLRSKNFKAKFRISQLIKSQH